MSIFNVLIFFVALISLATAYRYSLPKRHVGYRITAPQQSTNDAFSLDDSIWASRRKIIRSVLSSSAKKSREREEKEVEEEPVTETEEDDSNMANIYVPVFIAVVGAVALRLGGRGAFVSLLGLDFVNDSGIKEQINSMLLFFQAADPNIQFVEFFFAWFAAKALCLDPLTVILALSSGILFSNMENPLLFGTAASVLCSSTASFICFSTFRRYVVRRDATNDPIGLLRSPILKAVDRACGGGKGIKTVFALRLCQPIPGLPVGAYNYLFGAIQSVSALEFLTGITVASIKPYFLDCYLGIFGKSIMDNTVGDELNWVPVVVTALIVAMTSLTADFATNTWTEIQTEIDLIQADKGGELEGENVATSNLKNNKSTFFTLLGIAETDLPKALQAVNRDVTQASDRLKLVIEDEWERLCSIVPDPLEPPALSASSLLFSSPSPSCTSKQSLVKENVKRILNGQQPQGQGEEQGSGSGAEGRQELFDFEKEPDSVKEGAENMKHYIIESVLFSFVLFGSFLEYNSNS